MTYTGIGFSLKSRFKKIVLTQELVFSLKSGFTKILLTPVFPLHITMLPNNHFFS